LFRKLFSIQSTKTAKPLNKLSRKNIVKLLFYQYLLNAKYQSQVIVIQTNCFDH
jgi:hypothetical protein